MLEWVQATGLEDQRCTAFMAVPAAPERDGEVLRGGESSFHIRVLAMPSHVFKYELHSSL